MQNQVNQTAKKRERAVCIEPLPQAMRRIKKRIIQETLASCGGNRTYAARRLGISRPNLQNTMRRLGIR